MNAEANTSYTVNRALKLMMPPTIFSALVLAFLDMADVLIMTNIYGADGLVIASVFLPVIYFSYALFNGIGYGGSNLFAYYIGRKEHAEAREVFYSVAFSGFATALIFTAAGLFFLDFIAGLLLGVEIASNPANASLVHGVRCYGAWVLAGLPITALKLILTYFVRVDNNPGLAMKVLLIQAGVNIFFDLIFMKVLGFGPQGAAMALGLSQTIAFAILLLHFRKPCAAFSFGFLAPGREIFVKITRYSVSAIGDNIYDPIVLFIFNGLVLRQFGVDEASVFFVVMYCYSFVTVLGDGIEESISPLQGIFYGERDNMAVVMTTRRGAGIGVAAGALLTAILIAYPGAIAWMYGFENSALMQKCDFAVRMFSISIPFALLNGLMANAYQAIDRPFNSFIISFSRGFAVLLAVGCLALIIKSEFLFRQMFIITEITVLILWIVLALWMKKKRNKESLLLLDSEGPDYAGYLYLMLEPGTVKLSEYQHTLSEFLQKHGVEEKKVHYAALGLEEIALYANWRKGNGKFSFIDLRTAVQKDGSVRFITKFEGAAEDLMLKIKADREADEDYIGMRLLYKISSRFEYTCMMGFNCLDIVF